MAAPANATMNRLAKGQTWKTVGGTHGSPKVGDTFTIKGDGQGEHKDSCLCLWAPSEGLGHVACPCVYDDIRGERCYFAWTVLGGLSVIVWDNGKKMNTACCGLRVHYELVEPTVVAGGDKL